MTTTNTDYSNQVRAMVTDLFDLAFQAEVNQDKAEWEERLEFVDDYNIAFPLASLITLGYIEFSTLPQKALEEIELTWVEAINKGYFSTAWE